MACNLCKNAMARHARRTLTSRTFASTAPSSSSVKESKGETHKDLSSGGSGGAVGGAGGSIQTSDVLAEEQDDPTILGESSGAALPGGGPLGGRSRKFPKPSAWFTGAGQQYRRPVDGRTNWIGKTPYPLNESFKPPPPVSDAQKANIYNSFVKALEEAHLSASSSSSEASTSASPSSSAPSSKSTTRSIPTTESYHVRKLAAAHHLSMDRIRAIIRLKALESNTARELLQYKFSNVMEGAMGVNRRQSEPVPLLPIPPSGHMSQVQVENAVGKDYATGRRANWIMIDDENPAEFHEIEEEATRREQRRAKTHADFVNPQQSELDYKQRKGTDVRSKKYARANKKSTIKKRATQIEFVDVPSKSPAVAQKHS